MFRNDYENKFILFFFLVPETLNAEPKSCFGYELAINLLFTARVSVLGPSFSEASNSRGLHLRFWIAHCVGVGRLVYYYSFGLCFLVRIMYADPLYLGIYIYTLRLHSSSFWGSINRIL